ncbi:pentatricopeptide repeat-containing protein At5g09450, mitochondrial-like [Camellia sinensis]|uniref:pentatricopeptide repeat-containing protein At5g09450, mitochondrial-like n=1 Tax=Camellia sinensis TaxID=4442 RepID=UPI0010359DC0|nr:pentatricopeptide repeat-containing protein At5g09450, mitochondrial-like [Camellia sinensis]
MAARSIFLALTRNCRGQRSLSRSLSSSSASRSEVIVKESHTSQDEGTRDFNGEHDDLKSRISRLYLPRVGTSNILQKWVSEGRKLTSSDLRHIRDHLHRRPLFCDRHAFEVSFYPQQIKFLFGCRENEEKTFKVKKEKEKRKFFFPPLLHVKY